MIYNTRYKNAMRIRMAFLFIACEVCLVAPSEWVIIYADWY